MAMNYQEEFDKLEKIKGALAYNFNSGMGPTYERAPSAQALAAIVQTQAYLSTIIEGRPVVPATPALK
jgi:hypothetical protein